MGRRNRTHTYEEPEETPTCEYCKSKEGVSKKHYPNEAEARVAAGLSRKRGKRLKPYPCPGGTGFHLTSIE